MNEVQLSKKFKKFVKNNIRGCILLDMQSNPQDGVSDFIICANGKVLFVELKRDHEWTDNQKFFKFKCNRNNFEYVIIREEESFSKVTQYLEATKPKYTPEVDDDLCDFSDILTENILC